MVTSFKAFMILFSLMAVSWSSSAAFAQLITSASGWDVGLESLHFRVNLENPDAYLRVTDQLTDQRVETLIFADGHALSHDQPFLTRTYCALTHTINLGAHDARSIFRGISSPAIRRVRRDQRPYINPNGTLRGYLRLSFRVDNGHVMFLCFKGGESTPFSDEEIYRVVDPSVLQFM